MVNTKVSFEVSGKYALFTDPITRLGGEKTSYHIPTYQALKGILESVYWKPTLIWVIDRVRVMKPIQTESKSIKTLSYHTGSNSLSFYNYLKDVSYQVEAHFEWNMNRHDLAGDRNVGKHLEIANRFIRLGGKRPVFLGTSECGGYVVPCDFGSGSSAYENIPELGFGLMFHGYDYPDETGKEELVARLWRPVMKNGVLEFIPPSKCTLKRTARKMAFVLPDTHGVDNEYAFFEEGGQ